MTKLKVLTRIRHDGKIYKAGELLELEDEITIKRLIDHEAVEIIEGPVETENGKVDTNPVNDENLGDGNINPLDNENFDGGNSGDGSNIGTENPDGGNINPLDEGNSGDDLGDGTITLEEIQDMTIPQIKKLAEDNNIELHGKLKDELAQELFDKLGEE